MSQPSSLSGVEHLRNWLWKRLWFAVQRSETVRCRGYASLAVEILERKMFGCGERRVGGGSDHEISSPLAGSSS